MKNYFYLNLLLLVLPLFTMAQGFTTSGGNLIDANGNNFIMKGMNVPLAWFVNDVNGSIDDLKKNTNSNCLRIVVQTTTSDNAWQTCVQNCIDNDIIPMVELHDVTGSTDQTAMVRMAEFWASKASFLTRADIAKYILINICNEWGTWQVANTNGIAWRDATISSVKVIRDANIKTTIVCDAVGYGQDIDDAKNIRAYAKAIQAADSGYLGTKPNLLFSIHMYCEWAVGGDNIGIIKTIKDNNIPIIVGEFGYEHDNGSGGVCDINETSIINTCQTNGIGWLAWSQKGNGSPVQYLDLCSDWACTSLSTWGNTVVNGTNGTKTAITCSVFTSNPNIAPSVSITSPANNATFTEPATIALTATASDTDGTIASVAFYNGTSLLFTDDSSPPVIFYSCAAGPWVAKGTYTITAKATDNGGSVTTSAAVTVVVNENPCPTPVLGEDVVFCPETGVLLNSNVSNVTGVTFSWTLDGISIIGNTTSMSVNKPGTYAVTATKSGCTSKSDQIVATSLGLLATNQTICAQGEATLAVDGGYGGPYLWYDAQTNGALLHTGNQYIPTVSATTTFYVEDSGAGETYNLGLVNQTAGAEVWNLSGADLAENDKNVAITVSQDLLLKSISVYSGSSLNTVTIRILQGATIKHTKTFTNLNIGKQKLALDFQLAVGSYTIDAAGTIGTLVYQAEGAVFPYTEAGVLSFTGTQSWVITDGRYGLFYDWEIGTGTGGVACARTPVIATINPNAEGCTTAKNQEITLKAGWNLISLAVEADNMLIEQLFSSELSNLEMVKTIDAFWSAANPAFLNTLTNMKAGAAYLVKMKTNTSITISGEPTVDKTSNLKKGWNLVGVPLLTDAPIDQTIEEIGSQTLSVKNFEGFFQIGNSSNSITTFKTGFGYYYHVSADCMLTW
ncbi:MAG: cellulase family glycosylhydrolase [Bacteroidales bacterium]|nr:cellulase family glycosylhydrolase [Bacteroidales bacterium]